jgi:hypothetical protein
VLLRFNVAHAGHTFYWTRSNRAMDQCLGSWSFNCTYLAI